MGTGKSTIGKLLSEDMDYAYCDTDTMIEKNLIYLLLRFFKSLVKKFLEMLKLRC